VTTIEGVCIDGKAGVEQHGILGAMSGLADTYRKMGQYWKSALFYKEMIDVLKEMYFLRENNPGYHGSKASFEGVTSQNLGP